MTREELDFIGALNMCDEISNEAYKKIMCHCEEQETCEDCISRKALLASLNERGIPYNAGINEMIMDLPSVKPKTEWIPVSERLPKDGQFVLFCDIDDDIMVGYHVKGRPETHFSQDGTYEDMKNVVAWMPLPEPYKESEGDNGD